jgi:probable phosphoglycerate mutase
LTPALTPGGFEVVAHTTVVLVRHGQAERVGAGDPGLTAQGHVEAKQLAAGLAREQFDAVYCSPLRRTIETAAPVCAQLGVEPHLRDGLAEFDRKANEYVLLRDLRAAGDPRYEACMGGDLTSWGTDLQTFRSDALAVIGEILQTHAGGRILVVTHGGVLNVLVGSVLGLGGPWFFFLPENCSITRVVADEAGRLRLASLNETRHLHV